jgi:hypothetical protein
LKPGPANTEAARRRLEEGNRLFVTLLDQINRGAGTEWHIMRLDPRAVGLLPGETGAPEQRPFAAFVGCADARVPIELIFSEGPNDLFVIRIAGNGLGSDVLGSLSFAVDHLDDSLRAIVVLGHSGCGAISAAVDIFLRPELSLSLATEDDLRGILDRSFVIVQASAHALQEALGPDVVVRPGYLGSDRNRGGHERGARGLHRAAGPHGAGGEEIWSALRGLSAADASDLGSRARTFGLASSGCPTARSRRLSCNLPRRGRLRQDRLAAEWRDLLQQRLTPRPFA